jgi:hypothetical protein
MSVAVAYDLGVGNDQRTLYLHRLVDAPTQAVLVEFDTVLPDSTDWRSLADIDWSKSPTDFKIRNHFLGGDLPGTLTAYIPVPLLVYTSGYTVSWHELFAPQIPSLSDMLGESHPAEENESERPVKWDATRERTYLLESGNLEAARQIVIPKPDEIVAIAQPPMYAMLVTAEQLPLAGCAVTLQQAVQEWKTSPNQPNPNPELRQLLDEVGWREPVALSLYLEFQPTTLTRAQARQIYYLLKLASAVQREPEPGIGRRLIFDLHRPVPGKVAQEIAQEFGTHPTTTAEALREILSNGLPGSWPVFETLYQWQQNGLLRDLTIAIHDFTKDKDGTRKNIEDVLLYDWLSDGERMFLGRIALFYLLKDQGDALFILDEPETHFNDYWKRQVVDILDNALGSKQSEVIIASHSSIALTDVFDTEITLLKRADGTTEVTDTPIPTFGTLPSEIMQRVFDAPNSIGQRAKSFLDTLLLLAEHPDEIATIWAVDGEVPIETVKQFAKWLQEQHPREQEKSKIPNSHRLWKILSALRSYTREACEHEHKNVGILDTLTLLEEQVGTSYFRFEILRRIDALRKREKNAAQD